MSENTQKDAAPSEVNQPPVKPSPVTSPPPPISSVPPNGTSPATSVGAPPPPAPPPPPPPPPPPSSSVPPNGTSPTTAVGAPPPHAPPPPPPPPVSGNTNKTSKQKSDMENVNEKPYKVSVQDLIKGKEKLKKTDFVDLRKKVKLNMKEIFDGFQIHDYFPLSPAMKYFSYQTDKITTLNLSRIEQLTDMFFFTLDDRKIELPHCGTLTLSGCYYITDMAVVFITQGKTFTNLTSVRFTACKKITERSLHYLFDRYSEITVKMICADVSSIYGKALQSLQRLKLTGCPLISPPSYVYENQKVIFVDSTLESLKTYKIVILVDPEHKQGLMSQMLINDYVAPLRILGNWKPGKAESKKDKEPDSDSDYHFNLFEIIYEQGLEDLILNNGSIVLLPYSLTEEKVAAKLADKIKMVLSKYPETVFMLCQIDSNKSEKETGVKKDVLQALSQTWMTKLSTELKHGEFLDGNDGDFNLSAYNFHDQQVFTIGKWCYEHLSKFLENSEDLLVECDIVDSDAMKLATTKAVEGLIKTYPWHGIQYYPLILGFLKDIVNKGFPVCPLMTVIDELPDTVRNVLNPVTCYAEMEKILELMHTRGFACFYGNIEDKPALTDLGKFEQCINNIFANPAPRQNYIKAIGLKVPCWTLEDMKKVLVDADWLLSYFNFTLFVSILEEAGCIFKFPCDMIGDDFRDSFVYVLNKDIPAEPMVPVCSVWSEVSPSQQTSKIYEFISSLNNSFFFKVIRVFSQVYRFTLLWKSGFIFHVGPIACFVEKTHIEETGVPVIFITARFDAVYHCEEWGDWEKLLMTSFNMVLTLVDSVVQKEKAFVKKCIPCPNCVDSSQMGNRKVMLNPKLCYHFTEIYSKSMEVETVRCKKELTKGIPKSMLFGPSDVSLKDFIPNHAKINKIVHVLKSDDKKLAEFSQAFEKNDIKALKTLQASALKTKDIKFRQIKDTLREPLLQFDEGIRCYLCQNCAVQGMDCPSNMFNGKTKKHCSCKHTTDMCTYCGICKNCISHLVDAFTTVQPQFDKSGSMFTIFDRKYTFTDHMNTDTFGSLEIVSFENFTITAYVGEGEENIVSYNTATGMVVPKCTKSQYIAKPGTRLSLCLATHPTVMEFPIYVYTLNKVLKTLHVNSVYSITMLKQLPEVKKGVEQTQGFYLEHNGSKLQPEHKLLFQFGITHSSKIEVKVDSSSTSESSSDKTGDKQTSNKEPKLSQLGPVRCKNGTIISLVKARLEEEKGDVLVAGIQSDLDLTRGNATENIRYHGGDSIQEELKRNYPLGLNSSEDIAIVGGGNLKFQQLYFGVLPHFRAHGNPQKVLWNFVQNCLVTADKSGYKTIAFITLGTGMLGYAADQVAQWMYNSFINFDLLDGKHSLKTIKILLHDQRIAQIFEETEQEVLSTLASGEYYKFEELKASQAKVLKQSDFSKIPVFQIKYNSEVIFQMERKSNYIKVEIDSDKNTMKCLFKMDKFVKMEEEDNTVPLSKDMEDDHEPSLLRPSPWACCGMIPTFLEKKMTMMLRHTQKLYLEKKVFGTTPNILLYDNVREATILCPGSKPTAAGEKIHPLCLSKDFHKKAEKWDMLHLVNCDGVVFKSNLLEKADEAVYLFGWHNIMSHYPVINIPFYDKLFPQLANSDMKLSARQIGQGIHEMINRQAVKIFVAAQEKLRILNDWEGTVKNKDKPVNEVQNFFNDLLQPGAQNKFQGYPIKSFDGQEFQLCPGHHAALHRKKNITDVPSEIFADYSHLITTIDLTENFISEIPGEMFSVLPNLQSLILDKNLLEKIPEEIKSCKMLTTLSVSDNNLKSLPESLTECKHLHNLHISRCLMVAMDPVISKITSLKKLVANDLLMTGLDENIGDLSDLEVLYINGNCLTDLPDSFVYLYSLKHLSIDGVAWFQDSSNLLSREKFDKFLASKGINQWLDSHKQMKDQLFHLFSSDSSGNSDGGKEKKGEGTPMLNSDEIGELNATIFNIFPRFGYKGKISPNDETPSGFPEEITMLKNLESLSLKYQAIVHVPESIANLVNLKSIILSDNPNLLTVAAEMAYIQLEKMELNNCPLLKTPPKEIREHGFLATLAYLRRLMGGSVECKRTKLILVGLGGAGKTSLIRTLMAGKKKAQLTGAEAITDGIDICNWDVELEDGEALTYSVWDFAGQTVYYNTHQFFLSNRAVYLLLWNVRLGHEHAGLNFWLSSISVHAKKAPIFVVGTHVDQVSKIGLPMSELKERYKQIEDFFFVSSYTGQGVKELKDHLVRTTLKQEYMGESIPEALLEMEDFINREKTKKSVNILDYSEIERIGRIAGILDKSELKQSVKFLHDLGALQHFSNEFLKSKVVINPQWIVDVMACVVSVKQTVIKDGKLDHKDIAEIWKGYPEDLHKWLLRLTEEYDLTFALAGQNVSIVPCLLPDEKPEEFDWPEIDRNSDKKEIKVLYKFHYLPAGLFNRAQVRLHEYSDDGYIWKRGSLLKKNEHIAVLEQHGDSDLTVKAQGPCPENILFLVHEVIEGLKVESFRGVTYDYLVPCTDCVKQNIRDPHMFSDSSVHRAVELKAPFLQCLKYFHTVSVTDLQALMPPDSSSDYNIHLVNAISGLESLHRNMMLDIFISYCPADVPNDDKSDKTYIERVYQDLKKEGYSCWFTDKTQHFSNSELVRTVMDSCVFLAFVSSNYANDQECYDIFKCAYDKKKPIVIVLVGESSEWKKQTGLGLLLTDMLYVNMTKKMKGQYESKVKELLRMIQEKMKMGDDTIVENPPVFISYCWANSKVAVNQGTKGTKQSVGYGDPRKMKDFLDENGVKCWIDTERVGKGRLFTDLARGLINAKLVIACVSDEYVASENCQKEFHYAVNDLELPVIIAVVGTGNKWIRSEIGYSSSDYPMVNFHLESENAYTQLLELVKENLPPTTDVTDCSEEIETNITTPDNQSNTLPFNELYELAQRKFLRQIVDYASKQDIGSYPRLFVLDIANAEEKNKNVIVTPLFITDSGFKSRQYSAYTLCECEEGWHSVAEPVLLRKINDDMWKEFAPYLSRVTAIMKHSKNLVLNCLTDPDGQLYTKWLDETSDSVLPDFKEGYYKLRQMILNKDLQRTMGNLSRCRLPSGKIIWLCNEHISKMKVTVLSNEDIVTDHQTSRTLEEADSMIETLYSSRFQNLQQSELTFDSANKSKRKVKGVKKKTLKTYKLVSPEEQGGLDDFKTKRAEFILESSFLDFMTDNLCLTNTSNQGMVNFKGHSKVKNRDLSKRFGGQYKGASSLQKNIVNKKQTLKHVERKTSRKVMYMSDQTANKSEKMIGEISANENSEKDSDVENETAATNQNQHMKHVAGTLQKRPMSSPVPNRSEEKEGLRVHTSCSDPDDIKPSEASVGQITEEHRTTTQLRALHQNSLRTRQKSKACIVM